jgi:hypothetical protein
MRHLLLATIAFAAGSVEAAGAGSNAADTPVAAVEVAP